MVNVNIIIKQSKTLGQMLGHLPFVNDYGFNSPLS